MLPNVFALAAAVLAGAAGSAAVVLAVERPEQVAVSHVVRVDDAETVEVRVGDRVTAVKLANVDAPEPAECLHQEAVAALTQLLPEGTQVTVEQEGQFVALSTPDRNVNLELLRTGLAVPTTNGTHLFAQAKEASHAAAAGQRGLHSPDVSCTLPGQVRAITEAATVVEAQPLKATRTELTVAADTAKAAIGLVDQLSRPGGVTWDAVAPVDQTMLLARVTKAVPTLYRKEAELRNVVKGLR